MPIEWVAIGAAILKCVAIAPEDLARVDQEFLAATGREFAIVESSEYVSLADGAGG